MSDQPFVSYGQNREDVVLWRALGKIRAGRYVEVGANDPVVTSISKAFYDRGWSGITIEPDPECAQSHRDQRPRDELVEAAITDREGTVTLHLFPGTGLSTLYEGVGAMHIAAGREGRQLEVGARRLDQVIAEHGFDQGDVHFVVIDVEGAEAEVLRTVDLGSWRPWVLVIEATHPNSTRSAHEQWEPAILRAGYRLCQFDGVSRFYVAEEHAAEIGQALSYPACALDQFVTYEQCVLNGRVDDAEARANTAQAQAEATNSRLTTEILRWRTAALSTWARAAAGASGGGHSREAQDQMAAARREVEAMRQTVSWRVTRPLRTVRRVQRGRHV